MSSSPHTSTEAVRGREKAFKAYVGALAARGIRLSELVLADGGTGAHMEEILREGQNISALANLGTDRRSTWDSPRVETIHAIWVRSGAKGFIQELDGRYE